MDSVLALKGSERLGKSRIRYDIASRDDSTDVFLTIKSRAA